MAAVEAQIKPEFANRYPAVDPGRWYNVNQGERELDSDTSRALHLDVDGELIEVPVEHMVRRKVGAEI